MDIARHTYSKTEKGIAYISNYSAEYEKNPKRIAYKKAYEKTRVVYQREYKRKRRHLSEGLCLIQK